jgi:AmmeMemoRadiSam system protein B
MTRRRPPAVAGTFYEADPARLEEQVQACYAANDAPPARAPFIGAVTPHAGLMYSGHVAAALYARLELPKRLVILCPNHTGFGHQAAMYTDGEWLTPFGGVQVDVELAAALAAESTLLADDPRAHAREHSLEVQLPFLQRELGDFSFVPICLATYSLGQCEEIGETIATVVARWLPERIGILASSDMNHYENQQVTLRKDQLAIDRVLALDPHGLWETVQSSDISMCGFIPTTAMLFAANRLGATKAELVKHATSGDISGDYSAVVGYASIVVS